jgi:hypothetical protein
MKRKEFLDRLKREKGEELSSRERWRQNQIRQGLCTDCTQQAEYGRLRCPYHMDYQRRATASRIKAYTEKLRKERRCTRCATPLIEEERISCSMCKPSMRPNKIMGDYNANNKRKRTA